MSAQRIPLAPSQRGIYFLHRLAPDSPVYNVPIGLRVRGPLSLDRLQRAVDALVVRHEALRTTFEEEDCGPVQVIHPPDGAPRVTVRVAHHAVEPGSDPVAAATAEAERRASAPFDLVRGPLWRVDVVPIGVRDHAVTLTFDHIVLDEASVAVLAREFRVAYVDPAALPAVDAGRGYIECCREELVEPDPQGLAYWRENLRGAGTRALPQDLTVPPAKAAALFDGERLRFTVDESTAKFMTAFCAAHRVSAFIVFHAAFAVLLHGWTGDNDIVIGAAVQGRADDRFAETVGYFQNTVVLRTGVEPDQSFADLLARGRRTVLGALQHRRTPFEVMVQAVRPARDAGRNPLFQAAIGYNRVRIDRGWDLDGLAVEPLLFEWPITQFDLNLFIQHDAGMILGEITYDPGRFHSGTMLRLAAAYGEILAAALAEPGRTVAELPRLPDTGLPWRPARPTRIPLSYAQRGLWFLHQLQGPSPAYNVPLTLRIPGPVDAAAMGAAVEDVVARHESLRTVLVQVDGEPCQVVRGPAEHGVRMRVVATTDEKLDSELRAVAGHAFDLAAEVPILATLFTTPSGGVLLLLLHGIAADGCSLRPLQRDLGRAYAARCGGAAPDWPDLPAQYTDFTLWQRAALGTPEDPASLAAQRIGFWRTALVGLPEELSLPSDRPRPPVASYRGGTIPVDWDAGLHAALVALANRTDTTLFMVLQAGLAALLSRLGAGTDIPLGTPAVGRGHEAYEDLVGCFANTVVLRTDVSGDPTFRELLHRVRRADLAAFAAADLPFDLVVNAVNPVREVARHPLFQVVVSLHRDPSSDPGPAGVTGSMGQLPTGAAKVDLSVSLFDAYSDSGHTLREADATPTGIRGNVEYAVDLFNGDSVESLAARLESLLRLVAADPDRRVSDLDLLGRDERQWLLAAGSGPQKEVPAIILPDLVARQAARTPDATAVVRGPTTISYAALCSRVNQVARLLIERGVTAETFVVVALPRSIDLVVALLAVLAAGGAGVPADPDLPAGRVAELFEDADPVIVITDGATGSWPEPGDRRALVMSAQLASGYPDHDLDSADREPPAMTDAAYVVFTSGATGPARGVVIEHGQLASCLAYATGAYAGAAATVAAWDPTVTGMFAPLTVGGTVHIADLDAPTAGLPAAPSLLKAAPNRLPMLADLPTAASPGELVLSGEALLGKSLRIWRRLHPLSTVITEYGSAETTAGCVAYRIEPGRPAPEGPVPIGRPVWNTRVYVLDAARRPVPVGVPGEIYLSGAQVARGYLNRPALTAERFLPDPFGPAGSRMYRTGDLGRFDASGDLFYLRRTGEVKIRGSQVEPVAVAAALAGHPWVADVLVEVEPGPQPRLVAYVVPTQAGVTDNELRAYLADRLPSHLIPAAFVRLAALPLSATGRVDRRALPPPRAAGRARRLPSTPTEAVLRRLFARVLGRADVGVDDDFFDLGGHSLLAIRLTALIGQELAVRVPVRSVIARPTVAALAAVLDTFATGADHRTAMRPGDGDQMTVAREIVFPGKVVGA